MASAITGSSDRQVRTLRLCSDDTNDNVDNDTDSNTNSNSNANATNAADSSDTVNRKMNPEEEEEQKRNIIFQIFRSEHMEEVRTSFEIIYERLSYYHTSASIALTKRIDWIGLDSIRFIRSLARSLAHSIDPLYSYLIFRKLLVIASDNAAKKEKWSSRKGVAELPCFHRHLR